MQTTMKEPSRAASAQPKTRIAKILVPFDFGEPAQHALEYARELARQLGASLDVISVVSVPYALPVTDGGLYHLPPEFVRNVIQDTEKRLAEAAGTEGEARHRTTVTTGDPRAEILTYAQAENVDLIVMGTRGRTGPAHLIFGSVAEHIVRNAPCAVLTVR